jgi:HEPN domain-containing protein
MNPRWGYRKEVLILRYGCNFIGISEVWYWKSEFGNFYGKDRDFQGRFCSLTRKAYLCSLLELIMTNEEKVQYWVDLSDYDMETAEAMLREKRFLYVGFMCHQAIEKIFKGYYTKLTEETPPFVHKLTYLARHGNFYELLTEEQQLFVEDLEPLNIETRYPEYKERLLRKLIPSYCVELITNTKALLQWTKEQI